MVKYAKRRYYGRVSNRQFNYIARNYLKYKVKASYQVRVKQELAGDTSITFQSILQKAPDFTAIGKQFLQYKITGVHLSVAPISTSDLNMQACRVAVSVMQVADDASFLSVAQSPNSLNLGQEPCSRYVKVNTAWVSTSEIGLPSMKIVTNTLGIPLTGEITYNYIVTLYITFKNPA